MSPQTPKIRWEAPVSRIGSRNWKSSHLGIQGQLRRSAKRTQTTKDANRKRNISKRSPIEAKPEGCPLRSASLKFIYCIVPPCVHTTWAHQEAKVPRRGLDRHWKPIWQVIAQKRPKGLVTQWPKRKITLSLAYSASTQRFD